MLCSLAAWATRTPTPTICTTCYECCPTPGSRARERKLRGFPRLLVFPSDEQKDQVQRLCSVQFALRGTDVRRGGPVRPLRRTGGDHGRGYDGVAHSAHSSVGMPRPGRRPARPTRQPPGGAGGAQALAADNTRVGAARAAALRRPCHHRRTHLAITGPAGLCPRANAVPRFEGFDHGPRGTLRGLRGAGLRDGRSGTTAQTTLLLQESRVRRGHGLHSIYSVGIDGLCRFEGLARG